MYKQEDTHRTLVFVLDGLSQYSFLNPALAFQGRAGFRLLCCDKRISHSNQCHMHIFLFVYNQNKSAGLPHVFSIVKTLPPTPTPTPTPTLTNNTIYRTLL